jgi:hypothetical protein
MTDHLLASKSVGRTGRPEDRGAYKLQASVTLRGKIRDARTSINSAMDSHRELMMIR